MSSSDVLVFDNDEDQVSGSDTMEFVQRRRRRDEHEFLTVKSHEGSKSRSESPEASYFDAEHRMADSLNDNQATTSIIDSQSRRPHSTSDLYKQFSRAKGHVKNHRSVPYTPPPISQPCFGSPSLETPPRPDDPQVLRQNGTPLRYSPRHNQISNYTSPSPISHTARLSPETPSTRCSCSTCRKKRPNIHKSGTSHPSPPKSSMGCHDMNFKSVPDCSSPGSIPENEKVLLAKIVKLEAENEDLKRQVQRERKLRTNLVVGSKPSVFQENATMVQNTPAAKAVVMPQSISSPTTKELSNIAKDDSTLDLNTRPSDESQSSKGIAPLKNIVVDKVEAKPLDLLFSEFYKVSFDSVQTISQKHVPAKQPPKLESPCVELQRSESHGYFSEIKASTANSIDFDTQRLVGDQFSPIQNGESSRWQDLPLQNRNPDHHPRPRTNVQFSDGEQVTERGSRTTRPFSVGGFMTLKLDSNAGFANRSPRRTSKSLSPVRALQARSRSRNTRTKQNDKSTMKEPSIDETEGVLVDWDSDIDLSIGEPDWEVISKVDDKTENWISIIDQRIAESNHKQEQPRLPITYLQPFSLPENDDTPQKINLKNSIARLTGRVRLLRSQIQDQRSLVSDTHEEIFKANENLTNLITRIYPHRPGKVVTSNLFTAFEEALKVYQSKRDDLGPLADELAIMENRLSTQEEKLAAALENLFKIFGLSEITKPATSRHIPQVNYEKFLNHSLREDQHDSDSDESSSQSDFDYPPHYVEWQDRLGQEDILKETLGTYAAERKRLQEEKARRSKFGMALNPADEKFILEFSDLVDPIQKEISIVEKDAERLRLLCLREGIIDEDGELIENEDSGSDTAEGPSASDHGELDFDQVSRNPMTETTQQSVYHTDFSDYMHVSGEGPVVESFFHRQEKNRERVNFWLLEKLSLSTIEVWLLATIVEVFIEDLNEQTLPRILSHWDSDDAGKIRHPPAPVHVDIKSIKELHKFQKHIQDIRIAGFDRNIAIFLFGYALETAGLFKSSPKPSVILNSKETEM